jgi:hypothetical protein
LDCNDEGRRGGGTIFKVQPWFRVWHKKTNDERSEDVEEQDTYIRGLERYSTREEHVLTDINTLDRSGEIAPWVLGLSRSDCYNFCADEGECCLGHDSPPAQESPLRPVDPIELGEGTGILPVAESQAIVVGST